MNMCGSDLRRILAQLPGAPPAGIGDSLLLEPRVSDSTPLAGSAPR
jgi:hypothetical protein